MKNYARAFAVLTLLFGHAANAVFINEIHYDNLGSDVGEGIELAGAAGTDLTGYALVFYNGGNGQVYRNVSLKGALDNQSGGMGTEFFAIAGLQNGGPDGVALIDSNNQVLQFLSYEGVFAASEGVANGLLSTDIGVSQDGTNAVGQSLQLVGTGLSYADFEWAMADASYGSVNNGQQFAPVPLPATLPLMVGALGAVAGLGRQSRRPT